jgi:hypothetical protein
MHPAIEAVAVTFWIFITIVSMAGMVLDYRKRQLANWPSSRSSSGQAASSRPRRVWVSGCLRRSSPGVSGGVRMRRADRVAHRTPSTQLAA